MLKYKDKELLTAHTNCNPLQKLRHKVYTTNILKFITSMNFSKYNATAHCFILNPYKLIN